MILSYQSSRLRTRETGKVLNHHICQPGMADLPWISRKRDACATVRQFPVGQPSPVVIMTIPFSQSLPFVALWSAVTMLLQCINTVDALQNPKPSTFNLQPSVFSLLSTTNGLNRRGLWQCGHSDMRCGVLKASCGSFRQGASSGERRASIVISAMVSSIFFAL